MLDNPHMLPKVRSEALMAAMAGMPCSLRIASFIPGRTCSGQDTVVGAHLQTLGKGVNTKVSDMSVAAACRACHALQDWTDREGAEFLRQKYPAAVMERFLLGLVETHARLIAMGIIPLPEDGRLV